MLVIMKQGATEDEIEGVMSRLESLGLSGVSMYGEERTAVAAIGRGASAHMDAMRCCRASSTSWR